MTNLVEELGQSYISQWCAGAAFADDNKAYLLRRVEHSGIVCTAVELDSRSAPSQVTLPHSYLKGFDSLAYPKLGFRNISTQAGLTVGWLRLPRSAARGMRLNSLEIQHVGSPAVLLEDLNEKWHRITVQGRLRSIFRPIFIPFAKGLSKLLAGELHGFAVSEDFAVALCCEISPDVVAAIYFRTKIVGHVRLDGSLVFLNKLVERHSFRKALFGQG